MKKCEICGEAPAVQRMCLIRCAEVGPSGEIEWRHREACPRCVSKFAVMLPDTTTRDLIFRTFDIAIDAVTHHLIGGTDAQSQ